MPGEELEDLLFSLRASDITFVPVRHEQGAAFMADEDVLISDVGSHKMTIAQNYPAYEPNTCLISNGLAAMGIAVPGGVAADLAVDGEVVAATGDGGFLMNAAEIDAYRPAEWDELESVLAFRSVRRVISLVDAPHP